jgi:hypothetical protein
MTRAVQENWQEARPELVRARKCVTGAQDRPSRCARREPIVRVSRWRDSCSEQRHVDGRGLRA